MTVAAHFSLLGTGASMLCAGSACAQVSDGGVMAGRRQLPGRADLGYLL